MRLPFQTEEIFSNNVFMWGEKLHLLKVWI